MHLTTLPNFLLAPTDKTARSRVIFWFSLSLTFAAIFGFLAIRQSFSSEYVVQDDARQHVFWLERFSTPGLFPNDLIADYFQSAAPVGYTTLYRVMAVLGIHPLLFAKILPLILGVLATGFCFGLTLQILPIPVTGFIASMLLNLNLWMKDDLASATPRAFLYPIFLAFLYFLLKRSLIPCLVTIALEGLFYPTLTFVSAAILLLRLLRFEQGRLRLSSDRRDYLFCGAGLALIVLTLLPFALAKAGYGPVIKATEARQMPEFQPGGRSAFFHADPITYWLTGRRSSIRLPLMFLPELLYAGLALPLLLRVPSWFPLVKQVSGNLILLPQLAIASLSMFFAAQMVLFKLHFPDRYSQHGLRIVMVLATAIALTILLDALFQASQRAGNPLYQKSFVAIGATALVAVALLTYPVYLRKIGYPFPTTNIQIGRAPELYRFFAQQPKDTLVASLAGEANNIPSFSQRSVLVSSEYAIPLHKGYYAQIRQRTLDLLQAQYSPTLLAAQKLIQTYQPDFWLIDRKEFEPDYLPKNAWLMQYQPLATEIADRVRQGQTPALISVIQRCSAFETGPYVVLRTDCIAKIPQP